MPRDELERGTRHADLLRIAVQTVVYIAFYFATAFVVGPLLAWTFGYIAGITTTGLLAAVVANGLCVRIYEHRQIAAIGLLWDKASVINLALGCVGGIGSAALVLSLPLLAHAAHFTRSLDSDAGSAGSFALVTASLLFGAAGEEMLFRGYGFQVLVRGFGDWATILPIGIIFAALHAVNPHSTWLGLANTAGFGILFGYAFVRSHDLWLPIGLHFGWNFTLPLFGVNVSGLTMRLTGFNMEWSAGALWSGGEYGPEASILTSVVLVLLYVFIWKAPVRRQHSALLDPPLVTVTCVPGPPLLPLS
jgi:membrane protease YdiL (CAAX protease family)